MARKLPKGANEAARAVREKNREWFKHWTKARSEYAHWLAFAPRDFRTSTMRVRSHEK